MPIILNALASEPAQAVDAIKREGCFVLRGAADALELARLHDGTLRYFDLANKHGAEAVAEALALPLDHVSGHVEGSRDRGVTHHSILSKLLYDDFHQLERVFAEIVASERVYPFLHAVLGACVLHSNNLAIRYRDASRPELALPFHQDLFYWKQPDLWSGEPIMLVVWLPFTDCDANTPGLEVVPVAQENEFPLHKSPKTQFTHLEATVPDDLPVWYPDLKRGDAVVFTERTLHRSYAGPTKHSRTSVDIRVFKIGKTPRVLSGHRGLQLPDLTEIDL